jgi:hypothetical protein
MAGAGSLYSNQKSLVVSTQGTDPRGDLSYFLGGKAKSDPKDWTPDLSAVHATIKYAIATGRFDRESEQVAA